MTVLLCLMLAACTPLETVVQTAIAQTQEAVPTVTITVLSDQNRIQTAVAQTLVPLAMTSTVSSQRIPTAVIQTLTALAPTQTLVPPASPTPLTPIPTLTNTHVPWPTITNTPEAIIPSGPITLDSVEDNGNNQARLTWEAAGSFVDGLYVVWSPHNAQPAYPDDYWFYFASGHTRTAVVDVKQAGTYYFRVCEFTSDHKHCTNYSNAIQLTIK